MQRSNLETLLRISAPRTYKNWKLYKSQIRRPRAAIRQTSRSMTTGSVHSNHMNGCLQSHATRPSPPQTNPNMHLSQTKQLNFLPLAAVAPRPRSRPASKQQWSQHLGERMGEVTSGRARKGLRI